METRDRPGSSDLEHLSRLEAEPWNHHLFQAIRILEAAHSGAPRLGETRRPSQDMVRLGQTPSVAFPGAMVDGYAPGRAGAPARLTNRMFGFFGPQGPLPLHLTEFARDRQRNTKDTTFTAFVDMLTHRLASLFYRAWSAGQPAASFDNARHDAFGRKVDALIGRAGPASTDRDQMADLTKRFFAGHLSAGPKSAGRLQSILATCLGAPVRLQEFVGTWLDLEPDDLWRLGSAPTLGRGTVLGQKVWSRAAKFRVRIGPLGFDQYRSLLPGSRQLSALDATVRNVVGDRYDWDINLVLKADEVPRMALNGTSALGHTSWIGTRRETAQDACDLFFSPVESRAKPLRSDLE